MDLNFLKKFCNILGISIRENNTHTLEIRKK